MLRLPQFLHLHLVSNTIMLCNKCKKKIPRWQAKNRWHQQSFNFWKDPQITRELFCFSPKTGLHRIVTSCYIVYSKTKFLLPAAIEVCGLTGICYQQSSFKPFFCGHSPGFNFFALFPAMTILQRQGKHKEQKLIITVNYMQCKFSTKYCLRFHTVNMLE